MIQDIGNIASAHRHVETGSAAAHTDKHSSTEHEEEKHHPHRDECEWQTEQTDGEIRTETCSINPHWRTGVAGACQTQSSGNLNAPQEGGKRRGSEPIPPGSCGGKQACTAVRNGQVTTRCVTDETAANVTLSARPPSFGTLEAAWRSKAAVSLTSVGSPNRSGAQIAFGKPRRRFGAAACQREGGVSVDSSIPPLPRTEGRRNGGTEGRREGDTVWPHAPLQRARLSVCFSLEYYCSFISARLK